MTLVPYGLASQAALATKLAEVTATLGWVEKRGKNREQGYAYVQASDVIADVRAELASRHIAFLWDQTDIIIDRIEREGKAPGHSATLKGNYSFYDGDSDAVITGGWTGFATDTSDKCVWKAITGALKYVLTSCFLLPTGDDPENDSTERTAVPPPRSTGPTPPPAVRGLVPGATLTLTTPQIVKLKASLGDNGLKTDGQKAAFTFQVLGAATKSRDMTSADMDKILEALGDEDPTRLQNALAVK
jgi:hypothetical protein